ncbi:MAG TPA: ribonuclease HI family protein [Terracidiphilus sp.]|nr:ribonuclease HI family protein [Terracidiphilus sp.]
MAKNYQIQGWFDGCCEPKNPGGHAAWGAVLHVNGESVYRAGGYCGVGPAMSNNVAEYSAFIAVATECLKYPGFALIRGDSKLVVMQLNGRWKVHGGLYLPFYKQAKALWDKLKNRAHLAWIPREQNDICDVLSKKVLKDMGIKFMLQPDDDEPSDELTEQYRRALAE